jgi:RHS repeat-associated protein
LTYIGTGTGDGGDQYTGLDRFGRVVEQKWYNNTTATTTDDFKYGYDRDSNVLWRTNEINHNFDELYHANGSSNGYDNLNQLVAFARGTLNAGHDTISSPSHSINYTLDAEGNFSSTQTDGGASVSRTHNKQNEVTGVGAATLTFDANGNLTKDDAGQQYVYDAWNRLVAVKNSGGTTIVSYKYDGLSHRIVENPGTVHDLYYDAAWQVLEERWAGVSTATIQYVWSPVYIDALVLRDRSTQNNGTLDERLCVQEDANYNVTALINGSGSVVERYVYDPYGKQSVLDANFNTRSSSSYAFNIGFQGLRLDTTSGLYNERNRDLHPGLGRWIQTDPLGFGGGDTNLYRAEGNRPTNVTDPSGELGLLQVFFGIREVARGGNFFDGVGKGNLNVAKGVVNVPIQGALTAYDGRQNQLGIVSSVTNALGLTGIYQPNYQSSLFQTGASVLGLLAAGDFKGAAGPLLPFLKPPALQLGELDAAGRQDEFDQYLGSLSWALLPLLGRMGGGRANGCGSPTGSKPIGKVNPPIEFKPGSTLFGDAMHLRIAEWLRQKHPGVEFRFRVKPGQKGIDVEVISGDPGFKYAEIKPRTPSGQTTLEA